jgi:hypothetical protein
MKLNLTAVACASVLVSQVAVSFADDTDVYGVGEFVLGSRWTLGTVVVSNICLWNSRDPYDHSGYQLIR